MGAEESFARVERELQEERAAALARIAGRLGELVAQLGEARHRLAGLSHGERQEALESYRGLHAEARLYRWYLEVQREAVGLRRHDGLDELYPIPLVIDA